MSNFASAAFLLCLQSAIGANIALYPLTGCRSHDTMMRSIGQQMDDGSNNLTWIQTYVFHFHKPALELPYYWNRISVTSSGLDDFFHFITKSLWQVYFPFDHFRIWDARGLISLLRFHVEHKKYTTKLLQLPEYANFFRGTKPDLVIIDQILNEYNSALASLHDAPTVQVSNYPLVNYYTTSQNLPKSPAAVPSSGNGLSGLGMPFLHRVFNTINDLAFYVTRSLQFGSVRYLEKWSKREVDLQQLEAKRIFYAARTEFFSEVTRPINHRIKFFGCSDCGAVEDHIIIKPSPLDGRRRTMYSRVSHNETMLNYNRVEETFSNFNMTLLNQKFVLISFGTITNAEFIEPVLLEKFFAGLTLSRFTVIWQTAADMSRLLRVVDKPPNVHFVKWVPMKSMLAHPNIQYIIAHGGVNTLNELIMFGVPLLGIPFQGDQASNIQRMVDLEVGDKIALQRVWRDQLPEKITDYESKLQLYWNRMTKFSEMVKNHKELGDEQQEFWLKWTLRHGKKLLSRKIFRMEYILDMDTQFSAIIVFATILPIIVISF